MTAYGAVTDTMTLNFNCPDTPSQEPRVPGPWIFAGGASDAIKVSSDGLTLDGHFDFAPGSYYSDSYVWHLQATP